MFEMPSKERLDEIMKDVPDVVNVFFRDKGSYLLKCKYAIWLDKIAKEIGVDYKLPISSNWKCMVELLENNKIPNFAVLETAAGEYFISFGDDDEKDPIIALTRDFYEECTNGYVYVFSPVEVSRRAIKCMRRCAICWYNNLVLKDIVAFR